MFNVLRGIGAGVGDKKWDSASWVMVKWGIPDGQTCMKALPFRNTVGGKYKKGKMNEVNSLEIQVN